LNGQLVRELFGRSETTQVLILGLVSGIPGLVTHDPISMGRITGFSSDPIIKIPHP
jgi:hypothetical protein